MNHESTIKSSVTPPTTAGLPWPARWIVNKLHNAGLQGLKIQFWNGTVYRLGDCRSTTPPTLHLHSVRPLIRAATRGMIGWAEGYMAGEWDTPSLPQLTDWAARNEARLKQLFSANKISRWLNNLWHRQHDNTRTGSRRNIAYHYDLGNDFYRLWLDQSMTYSAALYPHPDTSLAQAQRHKYQTILDMTGAQDQQSVLEIGCGWGGFAELVATESRLRYEGITLSTEQLAWAQQRIDPSDQNQRVSLKLLDYRDIHQQYDHIVSIEMFEAVGESHWNTYFETLRHALKPGGNAVLQIICINENRFRHYRNNADFIQRYIFPGGMLPTSAHIAQLCDAHGLKLEQQISFGQDYATTLQCWHQQFDAAWPEIARLGYDPRFQRMWKYYLAYCESGFRHGALDVCLFKIHQPHQQPS